MSETLKLSARAVSRNESHARITVFQNGANCGTLTVDADQEANTLNALNMAASAPELLEACKLADVYLGWDDCSLKNVHEILRAAMAKAGETTEDQ